MESVDKQEEPSLPGLQGLPERAQEETFEDFSENLQNQANHIIKAFLAIEVDLNALFESITASDKRWNIRNQLEPHLLLLMQ